MSYLTEKQEILSTAWLERISECRSSGLTVTEWCTQNHISKNTYNYWLKKFRKMAYPEAMTAIVSRNVHENEFVELSIPQDTAASGLPTVYDPPRTNAAIPSVSSAIEIRKGGAAISIGNDIPDSLLSRLLEMVLND